MEEVLSVEWSEAAVEHLDKFYQFLLDKWSFGEAEKFLDSVLEFESIVAKHPNAFIRSAKKKKYRIGLIHQHVSAIYEVQKSKVFIVALIDNRARPKYR
jgi:plasmid stabilization system protein ParE